MSPGSSSRRAASVTGSTRRVSLVQSRVDPDDPRKNLEALRNQVEEHAESDLVVFPELALHGHALSREPFRELSSAVHAIGEEDYASLRKLVGRLGTSIAYGRLVERDGRFWNVATFTDGAHEVDYAKTHVHWTEPYGRGDAFPVFDSPLGKAGMLICFDAAFLEAPRILALQGARAILNLSAIPESFAIEHVHRRLVACSVYNQVYTLFANRSGPGFRGGSAVVDPRGVFVAVANDHQSALTVRLSLDAIDVWRREEPLEQHRRPSIYSPISRHAVDTPK